MLICTNLSRSFTYAIFSIHAVYVCNKDEKQSGGQTNFHLE